MTAALELWEQRSTTEVILDSEAGGGSPQERLRRLFGRVFEAQTLTGVDVSLLSHSDEPAIAEVLLRVTETRLDYITRLLRGCGLTPAAADAGRCSRTARSSGTCTWAGGRRSCSRATSARSRATPMS